MPILKTEFSVFGTTVPLTISPKVGGEATSKESKMNFSTGGLEIIDISTVFEFLSSWKKKGNDIRVITRHFYRKESWQLFDSIKYLTNTSVSKYLGFRLLKALKKEAPVKKGATGEYWNLKQDPNMDYFDAIDELEWILKNS